MKIFYFKKNNILIWYHNREVSREIKIIKSCLAKQTITLYAYLLIKKENILDLKYFQKWNDERKSKALYYYVGYYYVEAWCNIVVTCDVCIIHWGRKWKF